MTQPGRADGEAWIEVHADTSDVEPEIERGIKRAAERAEGDLKKTGEGIGEDLGDGINTELGKSGKKMAQTIEDAIERASRTRIIQTRWGWRDANSGRFVRKFGEDIESEVGEAFDRLSRRGGNFLDGFGAGLREAIGAGFNVSGKSPLIGVLIPLAGTIGGLILAALQSANALIAVLAAAPSLLTAIAAQVGVVYLAFKGVGGAVSAAFAAKNATELNEAIKGLTPSAQAFVLSLLPAKKLFQDIQKLAQENFFRELGGSVGRIIAVMDPVLRRNVGPLAAAMGRLFRNFADFFASPSFVKFMDKVFPATIAFLDRFGPDFVTFLEGLIAASNAALPMLASFGNLLSGTFTMIGYWLQRASEDPAFGNWLKDMERTLISLQGLFFASLGFIRTFLDVLNDSGGSKIIDELATALERLAFVLDSPVGRKGMEALVQLTILMIDVFTGLIIIVLAVIASIYSFFQALGKIGAGIKNWVSDRIEDFRRWGDRSVATVAGIPARMLAAVANLKNLLFNSGASLVTGLINGIRSKLGPLDDIARTLANVLTRYLPGSPAEAGPLSGQGYSLYRGQSLVKDFTRGMKMELPGLQRTVVNTVSSINFGPNAVQVAFNGAIPSPEQARRTGMAVGSGISSQLAARNTRLAVRTL